MNARELIAAFDVVADAPDGVKRLRELVLQLAVRGKLVEQDPQDEPASTITTELRRLRSSRRERATKDAGEARELGFELPRGWETLPLAEMCSKIGAGSTPLGGAKVYVDDGVMFLRSQNVWNDGLRLHDVARIVPDVHQRMAGTHVQPGDLLFNITGASIGRCGRVPSAFEPANVSQHVTIIRPYLAPTQHFLHLVLISDVVQRRVFAEEVGVSREGLSIAKLARFPVPLPPLAEQHRIVARVDELMGLLDRLEAARTARDDVRRAARDAALAALRDAEDTDAVEAAWGRIAGQMAALFAEPEDVGPLRQAVLGLAVRGRLVPTRPHAAAATGPFPIPTGWSWKTLLDLTEVITSGSRNWNQFYSTAGASFIRSQDIKYDRLEYDDRAYVTVPGGSEGTRTRVVRGDWLITITGANVGKCALLGDDPGEAYVSQHVALMRPKNSDFGRFGQIWLTAEHGGRGVLLADSYGAKPGLNLHQLRSLPVPVPPREERDRIVAKVDALMAICDALEARLTTTRDLHAQFAAAAVHHLDV